MKYYNTDKSKNIKINKNNTYLVLDFDRTITSNDSEDSWDVAGKLLGKDYTKKMREYYQIYRPIELDYKIKRNEKEQAMIQWYGKCMDLYYQFHLTQEKLRESVKQSNLIFRNGAKEFLKKAYQQNIPIIILSAGIGNVIEEFLKQHNCYFNNIFIISNFIEFDEIGKIKKFNNTKIIHSLNKTTKNRLPENLTKKLKNKKYKILIGDLTEDAKMVEENEWNNTLKIGILENQVEENLIFYKKVFDVILTQKDASFKLLDEIL